MRNKKNGFLRFIFSFMPGAAEMYMGFMKLGLSLMVTFFISIFIPAFLGLSDAFLVFPVIVWFYSFFHAINFSAMDEMIFKTLPDRYVWKEFIDTENVNIGLKISRKAVGTAVIVIGALVLFNNLSGIFYMVMEYFYPNYWGSPMYHIMDRMPGIVIAVLVIALGIKLIKGKKTELFGDETESGDKAPKGGFFKEKSEYTVAYEPAKRPETETEAEVLAKPEVIVVEPSSEAGESHEAEPTKSEEEQEAFHG